MPAFTYIVEMEWTIKERAAYTVRAPSIEKARSQVAALMYDSVRSISKEAVTGGIVEAYLDVTAPDIVNCPHGAGTIREAEQFMECCYCGEHVPLPPDGISP